MHGCIFHLSEKREMRGATTSTAIGDLACTDMESVVRGDTSRLVFGTLS